MHDRATVGNRVGQVLKATYRLSRLIGKGGMGEVYEADHISLPRKFAVKFLLAQVCDNPEVAARFHREASIAASLGSRHIVDVFDFDQLEDGSYFMVMEFLKGESLADRLKREGAMTPEQWLPLFRQVVEGLEIAHEAGIVHRDLKPENLFLTKERRGGDVIKILDFGISKLQESDTLQTRAGAILGTPNYMSPEQAEGAAASVTSTADIFSLGAIVYEVLSGQLAFSASSIPAVIMKICYSEPVPLEMVAPGISPELGEIVRKAMAKEPADRYPTVSQFLADYEMVLEGGNGVASSGRAGLPDNAVEAGPKVLQAVSGSRHDLPMHGQAAPQPRKVQFTAPVPGGPLSHSPAQTSPDSEMGSPTHLKVYLASGLGIVLVAVLALVGVKVLRAPTGHKSQKTVAPGTHESQTDASRIPASMDGGAASSSNDGRGSTGTGRGATGPARVPSGQSPSTQTAAPARTRGVASGPGPAHGASSRSRRHRHSRRHTTRRGRSGVAKSRSDARARDVASRQARQDTKPSARANRPGPRARQAADTTARPMPPRKPRQPAKPRPAGDGLDLAQ